VVELSTRSCDTSQNSSVWIHIIASRPVLYAHAILMSAPTDEFSKLRLEGKDMASRRSIAQQERRRRENEQRRRDSQALHIQQNSNVRPSTTRTTSLPGPTTLFESYTGIRYNASSMPQSTYRKAMTAMGSQLYCVNRAMRHQDQNGTYVAFQLQKSESVRIYDRSTESVPPAACSCQDFAEHRICSHIYVGCSNYQL
jgi:hypothetical protein